MVKLGISGMNTTLFLLAAVNKSFLSEVQSSSYFGSGVCDEFGLSRGNLRRCRAQSTATPTSQCIFLSLEFNVEQIRLHLTELVLYDGSLYSHRRPTAAASQGFVTARE